MVIVFFRIGPAGAAIEEVAFILPAGLIWQVSYVKAQQC